MQVTIRESGDLKRLNKQLREVAAGQLRKELTGGIHEALQPLVPQVKAAYRAGPSKQGKARRRGGSLRGLLAKSVRVEVRTAGRMAGARIRADGRRMPTQAKSLPAYWEGEKRPWRWPVYGNRAAKWGQGQAHPTFYRIVEPHEHDVLREIDRVFEGVKRKLEAGP